MVSPMVTRLTLLLAASVLLVSTHSGVRARMYTMPDSAAWPSEEQIASFSAVLTHPLLRPRGGADVATWEEVTFTYNLRMGQPVPAFVARVVSEAEIATALAFARTHALRVAVSSTGHHQDVRNVVDNALLIHLGELHARTYDAAARTITVGPGQTWGAIHAWLHEAAGGGMVAASGADATVGPAGWTLGGGHGHLTRMVGLGVDVVRAMRVVLPDGRAVTAREDNEYADLFWALRGGGGAAFGIVTALTFDVFDNPGGIYHFVGFYTVTHETADLFEAFMRVAPNHVGGYFLPLSTRDSIMFAMHCIGGADDCTAEMFAALVPTCHNAGVSTLCTLSRSATSLSEYLAGNTHGDTGGTGSLMFASTALDFAEGTHALRGVTDWMNAYDADEWGAVIGCSGNAVLGGVSTTMDAARDKTSVAPAMRHAVMAITCFWAFEGTNNERAARLTEKMYEWGENVLLPSGVDKWSYWNEPAHVFPNTTAWQQRYWGAGTYTQLRAVKAKYDPGNVLTCYHCVGWEDVDMHDPAYCEPQCLSCTNLPRPDTCPAVALPENAAGAMARGSLAALVAAAAVTLLVLGVW